MCISVLQDYLLSNEHHIKSISNISVDDSNSNYVCCESSIQTYSFDDVINEFCNNANIDPISSVDAISFCDGWLNLIEFKHSSCTGKDTKSKIKRKFNDTIRYFERIVLDKRFFDQTNIQIRIILVFNPDNNVGYNKLNNMVNQYANRPPADKDKLKTLSDYCNVLELCNEFVILYSDEFIGEINKYISIE